MDMTAYMDKLKLNDENRYIYGMVQKIPTATPLENFQRDTAAENQFYKEAQITK